MYEHKFEPTDGLLTAKSVIGNLAASEEKLAEGHQIASQLTEDFGKGEDLAVRVGYDDADGLSDARSRLDTLTGLNVRLEEKCDEVKEDLDSNLGDLRGLVLGTPDAKTSAFANNRADICAVVLQLLPLAVTDLPAALEKFPGLRDALSPDIIGFRQTQISSGQVDTEQLEDLRKQVEVLNDQRVEEAKKANSAARGKEKAENSLRSKSAQLQKLGEKLTKLKGELEEATAATESKEHSLEEFRSRAKDLEQKLERAEELGAKYRTKLTICEGKLEVESTNAQNLLDSAKTYRDLYKAERDKKAPATKSARLEQLEKDLEAERALNAASYASHAENMERLEAKHKAVVDRMRGHVDELRSQALKASLEISSKDTSLGKMQSDHDRLAARLEKYKNKLLDTNNRLAQARSDAKDALDAWREHVSDKVEELEQKDGELKQKDAELAEMAEQTEILESTVTRLRSERDDLRANNKAAKDSSTNLENAQRDIAALTEKIEQHRKQREEFRKYQSWAKTQLKIKDGQLKTKDGQLKKESANVRKLEAELCERGQQLESATFESDMLKDEAQRLQDTIKKREGMIEQKSKLIVDQARVLSDQEAKASGDKESSRARVQQLEQELEGRDTTLLARERELSTARLSIDSMLGLSKANAEQQGTIDSLREEIEGLRLHGSHRTEEMTENHRQTSMFLANMAGIQSDGLMFSGLVDAIIKKDDRFCAAAAPAMWTILRPWDGTPADAAGTLSPVPRVASLHIGAVLLLGEAVSGNLNTERSHAILDDLIVSVRSEDTVWLPMAVLTELARRVVMSIREAGNVRMEFSLAFWQLMELVDHRTGRVVPADSTWRAHKGSLSAELSQHHCALVFEILRDTIPLADHEFCRLLGDGLGLCSRQDWESAVMLDVKHRTLRFVDKALFSTPGTCSLRIKAGPGHDVVDLQLQPLDDMWLMEHVI